MSTMISRKVSLFLKQQTAQGVAVEPGSSDGVLVEVGNTPVKLAREAQKLNEARDSLNSPGSILGGLKVEIPISIVVRGSGVAGQASDWAILMEMGGFKVNEVAAATAPAAALTGTDISIGLPNSFSDVPHSLLGVPLALTVNPSAPALTFVSDYSEPRVAELVDQFAAPLDSQTMVSLLPHVRITSRADVQAMNWYTADLYVDGLRYRLIDARFKVEKLEQTTGGAMRISGTILGIAATPLTNDLAAPAILAAPSFDPPILRGGVFSLDRGLIGIKTASITTGIQAVQYEDPNAGEGFGGADITARDWVVSIDPMHTLARTKAAVNSFQSLNSPALIHWHCGQTPGNRLAVTIPTAKPTQLDMADDRGSQRTTIQAECQGVEGREVILVLY